MLLWERAQIRLLCELAGEQGHVIAFDIQEVALDYTKKRLENENLIGRAELILDGHEHMARYAGEKTVDLSALTLVIFQEEIMRLLPERRPVCRRWKRD